MFNQYNPFMYQSVSRPFSFANILNGAQKTLNIVNQAIPIVKEVRPIVKNARTLFNVAKGFNTIDNRKTEKEEKIIDTDSNGLNFFI